MLTMSTLVDTNKITKLQLNMSSEDSLEQTAPVTFTIYTVSQLTRSMCGFTVGGFANSRLLINY